MPLLAVDGPHYGVNLPMDGPGDYRLVLTIAPPGPETLGRVSDADAGVAPWWAPFTLAYTWTYPERP